MRRSRKITATVPQQQLAQVTRLVEGGEVDSAAAVVREALRAWLHRRQLHAGRHGAARLARSLEARRPAGHSEVQERVELMFDAGDAKA